MPPLVDHFNSPDRPKKSFFGNIYRDKEEIPLGMTTPPILFEDISWLRRCTAIYLKRSFEALGFIGFHGLRAAFYCLDKEIIDEIVLGLESDSKKRRRVGPINWSEDDATVNFYLGLSKRPMSVRLRFGQEFLSVIDVFVKEMANSSSCASVESRLKVMEETMGFSRSESELLRLLICLDNAETLKDYFIQVLSVFSFNQRPILEKILEKTKEEISSAMNGILNELALIDSRPMHETSLHPSFYNILNFPNGDYLRDSFKSMESPRLGIRDFFVNDLTVEMISGLLSTESNSPTHILLYGPAGVGKTQFARTLAMKSGLSAYEVIPDDSPSGYRRHLVMADSFARKRQNCLLIVDEADGLLGGDGFWADYEEKEGSKSFLDYFMEKPGSRCLWIANEVDGLPESVMRRFAFSLAFPRMGHKARRKVWLTVRKDLAGLGSDLLSDQTLEKLAREEDLSPAIIAQAFQKSLEAGADSEEKLIAYMRRQLRAHQELSGIPSSSFRVAAGYCPAAVTSTPSLAELKRILEAWKKGSHDSLDGQTGLGFLFHGPQGVGKKALALNLAEELDLEIIRVRPFDLMSNKREFSEYVFSYFLERAVALRGILLFEKIDYFWEDERGQGENNEKLFFEVILNRLDRFAGVFIATSGRSQVTNISFPSPFTLEVEFGGLKATGREELFSTILRPLSKRSLTAAERERLLAIPSLVPADFVATATKARWRGPESSDNFSLLEAMSLEASHRPGSTGSKPSL
ncbi:MAG: ATP-binding protein [Deltaproteobacteria bacterium]|nr:ATP-binding protein [Deltaproteobacteria bacterium]